MYDFFEPILSLGLPFTQIVVSNEWADWPALLDLFPTQFPGVQTGRDTFLIDTDIDLLHPRINDYFNPQLNHENIALRFPRVMTDTARFDARSVRETLFKRGGPRESSFVRYAYRPFDNRWLYWESETKLLREKSPHYPSHVFKGNSWLVLQNKARPDLSPPLVISDLGDLNQMNSGVYCIPAWLANEDMETNIVGERRRANLSDAAQHYLDRLGLDVEDLFHHVLAVLHDPSYRKSNAGALRAEGPRIPLPGWPEGDSSGAAEELIASTARGRELAALLDSETPVPGVTTRELRPEIASIAVPSTTDGGNMTGDDFSVTAGWGYLGRGEAVMPGQGHMVERPYTAEERTAMGNSSDILGDTTFDIYLNDRAYWRNVPSAVWGYKLGGYQVLKKWLSYRERRVLGRALRPEEVQHFTDTARRIAAILMLVSTK